MKVIFAFDRPSSEQHEKASSGPFSPSAGSFE
jgi:hypothetical protein